MKDLIFERTLSACQNEYLIDGTDSIWCKFFDPETIKLIEYREDIKFNCKFGYKYSINSFMACDLVKDLLENLLKFQEGYVKVLLIRFPICFIDNLIL